MEKQTKVKAARRKYDEGFKTEALRMVSRAVRSGWINGEMR